MEKEDDDEYDSDEKGQYQSNTDWWDDKMGPTTSLFLVQGVTKMNLKVGQGGLSC